MIAILLINIKIITITIIRLFTMNIGHVNKVQHAKKLRKCE